MRNSLSDTYCIFPTNIGKSVAEMENRSGRGSPFSYFEFVILPNTLNKCPQTRTFFLPKGIWPHRFTLKPSIKAFSRAATFHPGGLFHSVRVTQPFADVLVPRRSLENVSFFRWMSNRQEVETSEDPVCVCVWLGWRGVGRRGGGVL